MKDAAIIGAGRLGTSLGFALSRRGYDIKAVTARTCHSAEVSRQIIGRGAPLNDNIRAARAANIIVITVPDDNIPEVVKDLDISNLIWKDKLVFHCSGLYPAGLLRALESKGALTASVHPNQSFPRMLKDANAFLGVYFALEGGGQALAMAKSIVHDLGGHPFVIKEEDKPLYHTACSIASNFFVAILDVAVSLLQQCGMEEDSGKNLLLPLVEGTLQNVKKLGVFAALSGPIIRGDHRSVKMHLNALQKFPPYRQMYVNLASQALEIAKRRGEIHPEKIRAVEDLLEQK